MTFAMDLAYMLFSLAAAVLAVFGWLLPFPDGIKRFTFRYLACGAFLAAWLAAGAEAIHDHAWWRYALASLIAIWLMYRCEHWWKQVEISRRFQREIDRYGYRIGRMS